MPMSNHGLEFLQFPQPTRPINSTSPKSFYNMNFESSTPQARLLHQFRHSNPVQFPQPTRPINSMSPKGCMPQNTLPNHLYNSRPMQIPQQSIPYSTNNISYPYYVPEERYSYQYFYQCLDPATPQMTGEGESEKVEEIIRGISELYNTLSARLRGQENLDELNNNVTTTIERGLNVGSTSTNCLHGPVGELSHKLERFKIRTIDLGGVVKVEEEHK